MAEIKAAIPEFLPSFSCFWVVLPRHADLAPRVAAAEPISLSPEEEEEDPPEEGEREGGREIPPESVDILPSLRCFVFVSSSSPRVVLGDRERERADASFRGKSNGLSIPPSPLLSFSPLLPPSLDYWKNA